MSIQEIKQRLCIEEVLSNYGIRADKNGMLNCPFHDDSTPSMQVYKQSNTVFCFSSNCDLNSKSIDQIDFIMFKEGISKHQAIEKAKQMIGIIKNTDLPNLDSTFAELRKNLLRAKKAKEYLKNRNLSDLAEIGYNNNTINTLKECLIFPLKNKLGKIVSFYGRKINDNTNGKHYYSSNRSGLYPNYPSREVKTLILTESVIDALSIKQNTNYQVLALYGTNGLTPEHKNAIKSLKNLKEITFFLDGDEAGAKSIEKYSKEIHKLLPQITISKVNTPKNKDANSLIQSHDKEILNHLIEKREIVFVFEDKTTELQKCTKRLQKCNKLNYNNINCLYFHTDLLKISILGGINLYPLDKLKVTLKIEKADSISSLHKLRHNVDLYNDDQVEKGNVKLIG